MGKRGSGGSGGQVNGAPTHLKSFPSSPPLPSWLSCEQWDFSPKGPGRVSGTTRRGRAPGTGQPGLGRGGS